MAQPQAYERSNDFAERDGDDTDHPALNQELDAVAATISQVRVNMALLQNDDGGLKNGVVGADSLSPEAFQALQGDVSAAVASALDAAQSALTSATTANTAKDQAATSAAAAQTSQTAAALNAGVAATAAAAATGAQAAVAASAAAALVSENNADTSEAAALASANAAAASAATALADKSAAAVSAAAALTSANNADTSEAAALASQNDAAASAASAAASYDAFDDRYLGAKADNPAVDNDGAALVTGAMYFNTVATEMRVFNGVTWQPTAALVTLQFPTGVVVSHDDDVAPAGWVMSSGRTIGSAASGATERANADTFALFEIYWRTRTNALLPIQDSTGAASARGVSAAADFAANKRLPLPDRRGRVDAGKDDMGGTAASRLTSGASGVAGNTLGAAGGAQTHTLTAAEGPVHNHPISDPSHSHTSAAFSSASAQILAGGVIGAASAGSATGAAVTGISVSNSTGGTAHNNTQPTFISNKIIKL